MRVHPHELAIGTLGGEFVETEAFTEARPGFETPDQARQFLVLLTGEDFGQDAAAWQSWFARCDTEMIRLMYEAMGAKAR
jgi:LPS sulfotransferase NodH